MLLVVVRQQEELVEGHRKVDACHGRELHGPSPFQGGDLELAGIHGLQGLALGQGVAAASCWDVDQDSAGMGPERSSVA